MSVLGTIGKTVGGDLVNGGLSLLGGWLQSRAANKAKKELQASAAREATGLTDAARMSSGNIYAAGNGAADTLMSTGANAQAGINAAGQQGQQQIQGALQRFDPYSAAGATALQRIQAGVAPGGEFSGQFAYTPEQFAGSDALKFRLDQGKSTLQNSALSRGSFGGNFAKELEQFAQGAASEEYDKDFRRQQGTFQMNRENTLNPLTALVGVGERANNSILGGNENLAGMGVDVANRVGQIGLQTATGAGGFRTDAARIAEGLTLGAARDAADLRTSGATAGAAGTIGAGNAWADALSNISRSVDFGGLTRRKKTSAPRTGGIDAPVVWT